MSETPFSPLVSMRGVSLTLASLAGKVNVLRGIDLDIAAGESVGIIGPSGSGKSSLLMVLGGLEQASAGTISIGGQDLAGMNEDALARLRRATMGVVFQSFQLIPTMTARENVAVPLELAGEADALARAEQALERVGLAHRLDHYPGQLSGGEQQRVALARAVIAQPRLLLADEPTGNLDGVTGKTVADLLFALNRDSGAALVLVTHDPDLAHRCDRVVAMRDGRVVPS